MEYKYAFRINEICQLYGVGRTKLYQEIAAKRLLVYKIGRTTLISKDAADKWQKLCESESQKNINNDSDEDLSI